MFILSKDFLIENVIKYDENQVYATIMNKLSYYRQTKIPKKKGIRIIYDIEKNSELYYMQKNLQKNFLSKVPLPICVKGFCKETSYNDFLKEHLNRKYYIRIDIKDFFDSITSQKIQENLQDLVKTNEIIRIITNLCIYEDTLPQGAVTSPTISNIVFRRIDQRIIKYCQKFDVIYTRYADDLLFSSNKIDFKENKWFYKKIKYILNQNGYKTNYSKKHIEKNQLCIGGFVVKEQISLSRNKLKNINKILYFFKDKSIKDKYVIDKGIFNRNYLIDINELKLLNSNGKSKYFSMTIELLNYLCGYRSFLINIVNSNELDNGKVKNLKRKISYIEKIVKNINNN